MQRSGDHEGVPVYTVTRWLIYEATTTALPADTKVGIGRSTLTLRGTKKMEQSNEAIETRAIEQERERCRQIDSLTENFPYLGDLAQRAIKAGTSAEDFNQQALAIMKVRTENAGCNYGGPPTEHRHGTQADGSYQPARPEILWREQAGAGAQRVHHRYVGTRGAVRRRTGQALAEQQQ